MSKTLKWILIIVAGLLLLGVVGYNVMKVQTKKHSPEATVTYNQDGVKLSVTYSRPSKKGRVIFDGLIPYGKVWRTGANEATTFETDKDLLIAGQVLPTGKYTLWTIPGLDVWTVIFNSKQYGWGVGMNGEASMDPQFDVLRAESRVERLLDPVEVFTISFGEEGAPALVLEWDQTHVEVPFTLR